MYKNLIILIVLFFGFSSVPAQIKEENSPPTEAVKQADYSESKPYKPREFQNSDSKKKKKSKKDSDEKNAVQPDTEVSTNVVNNSRTVRIPVFVYDRKGQAVTDLQNSDFKVFVDDIEQEVAAFETGKAPRNILLILDTSPSLAYKNDDLKSFVSEMIKALKPDDKLQIISFNQSVDVLAEPTNDARILQKAVKKIKMGDGTSLYEAIKTINRKYLASSDEQPLILLLTDGVDTTSRRANYISSLVEAEKNGAVVFPLYFDSLEFFQKNPPRFPLSGFGINPPRSNIGLTEEEYELGRAYLQDIAALSGGKTFAVKNLSQIKKEEFEAAFKLINPNYYISIKRAAAAGTFQRKQIKVRVSRPNLTVQARGSYVTDEN